MKQLHKRHILIGSAALVVVAAALTVIFMVGKSSPGRGQAWVQQNIEEYRGTLAVATDPTQRAFVEDKLNRMEQIETNRLLALTNVAPKPQDPCALRPTPEPTHFQEHISGINPVEKAPFNPEEFTSTNQWQGQWAGQWVRVFAGAYTDIPSQGVLWVLVENTNDYGSYDAPTPGGALTINAENNLVLTLRDDTGATLYFDVASRKYLDTPVEKVATLVPMATFTPDTGTCPADLP